MTLIPALKYFCQSFDFAGCWSQLVNCICDLILVIFSSRSTSADTFPVTLHGTPLLLTEGLTPLILAGPPITRSFYFIFLVCDIVFIICVSKFFVTNLVLLSFVEIPYANPAICYNTWSVVTPAQLL